MEEGGLKLRVNLDDYLDTGLFLDHRLTRSAHRPRGGGQALSSICSATPAWPPCTPWPGARAQSLEYRYVAHLPGLGGSESRPQRSCRRRNIALLQADAIRWLAEQPTAPSFDLIFLDPPTFSNSARMQGVLDTQRDHARLIEHCMRLLAPQGVLLFSTNAALFRTRYGAIARNFA